MRLINYIRRKLIVREHRLPCRSPKVQAVRAGHSPAVTLSGKWIAMCRQLWKVPQTIFRVA